MTDTMHINTLVKAHSEGRRDFRNLNLDWSCSLEGADLSGAQFSGISFEQRDLTGANLAGSTFDRCDFDYTNLTGANVAGATFQACHFSRTNLTRANFSHVTIRSPQSFAPRNWPSADLTGTDMRLFHIDSDDRTSMAVLLRREAGSDPAKLTAIEYLEHNPQGFCWDGFVEHFSQTNPAELVWGLEVLKKYDGLSDIAASYMNALALKDIPGVTMPLGSLSGKLNVGDLVSYANPRTNEVTVQRVTAIRNNGLIVLDVPRRGTPSASATFMPDGREINPGTSLRGTIALVTSEQIEALNETRELQRLRERLSGTRFSALSLDKLRRVVEVIEE